MGYRGTMYLVRFRRRDGHWVEYRTCDRHEAERMAERFGANIDAPDEAPGAAWDPETTGHEGAGSPVEAPLPRQREHVAPDRQG